MDTKLLDLNEVAKAVTDIATSQMNKQGVWIPCCERLPEIEYTEHSLTISKYLVTMLRTTKDKKCSRARVDFALFMPKRKGDKWEGGTWKNDWLVLNETYDTEVIAWMPIPKPYDPIDGEMNPPEGECNDGARATYE